MIIFITTVWHSLNWLHVSRKTPWFRDFFASYPHFDENTEFWQRAKKDLKIASIGHMFCANEICYNHGQIAAEISKIAAP